MTNVAVISDARDERRVTNIAVTNVSVTKVVEPLKQVKTSQNVRDVINK